MIMVPAEPVMLACNWIANFLFCIVVLIVLNILFTKGQRCLIEKATSFLLHLPGFKYVSAWFLKNELKKFFQQIGLSETSGSIKSRIKSLPEKGLTSDELMTLLKEYKAQSFDPDTGKGFAYVYTQQNDKFKCIETVYDMFNDDKDDQDSAGKIATVKMFTHAFMHENALTPFLFPSLRQFEVEIVAMTGWMLNGPVGTVGGVTSGGTESILMALKTYRDRARDLFPMIKSPEVVAPITIHPAFHKAAAYFDLKMILVPLKNYHVDMAAYRKAISPSTILLVGSAPEYCHGIVDPIEEISQLALSRKLPVHVDACFGGFMLPWVEKCGYSIPLFDFRLSGVTSMSADIHKYGYCPKGASVLLYRNADIRKYQIFAYVDWPAGLFGSPGMAGSRPGANLASSWASLMLMGQDGYKDTAQRLMKVTSKLITEINEIEELSICGSPEMTAFAFKSDKINIFVLADQVEKKGWKIERGLASIHCSILPSHTTEVADAFLSDLKTCIQILKDNPDLSKKGAGIYGMAADLPARGIIKDFVVEFFNEMYTL